MGPVRLALPLAALALLLALGPPGGLAQGTIGNTAVVVFEADNYTKATGFASNVTYTWGLYNGGTFDYTINATLALTDPTFRAALYPASDFLLPRGGYAEVLLNVTTPASGVGRSGGVNVTLRAFNLARGSDDRRTFPTTTRAEWPPLILTVVAADAYGKEALFGGSAAFAWGVVNPNPYRINVTASVAWDDPGFRATLDATNFSLDPSAFRTVTLRAEAPFAGVTRVARFNVTLAAAEPSRGLTALRQMAASLRAVAPEDNPVRLLVLEPRTTSRQVAGGSRAEFRWVVYNPTNRSLYVEATAAADAPGLAPAPEPPAFSLAPLASREVYVNVTLPAEGAPPSLAVVVTFVARDNGTGFTYATSSTVRVEGLPATQTAPTSVLTLFIVVGFIIFVGFFATQMFYKTKVPDLLVLIGVGLLLGPVNAAFIGYPPALQLFNGDYLRAITPLFAALALMIILFDGGLNLNFDTILRNFKVSMVHTMTGFLLTMGGVAVVAHYVLGYPPLVGLLLGCILGGISGAIVVSLVRGMTIGEGAKVILALEAVLTDVLVIIGAISIIELIKEGGGGGTVALGGLLAGFSVATVIGVIFGLLWLKIVTRMHGRPYSFMITVAALFVLYAVVELAGSSGAMASLVFGLVLGNHQEFARMFKMRTRVIFDEKIRQFHMELAFVVRTFFFVFLGLVFTLRLDTTIAVSSQIPALAGLNGTYALFFLGAFLVVAAIVLVRLASSGATARLLRLPRKDMLALWTVMGRGLAAAVLASLPFTIPEFTADPPTPYYALMAPYEGQFLNITFLVIVMTAILTTVGVVLVERRSPSRSPAAPAARGPAPSPWASALARGLPTFLGPRDDFPPPPEAPREPSPGLLAAGEAGGGEPQAIGGAPIPAGEAAEAPLAAPSGPGEPGTEAGGGGTEGRERRASPGADPPRAATPGPRVPFRFKPRRP